MTSAGSGCVCVGEPGLRELVLGVLARRGYEVRLVEGEGLREALRTGETTVVALGAGQVDLDDIHDLCDRWSAGLARPIIALVHRRERHLAAAALAAGVTNIALVPIDAADLDLELALAERRSAERERFTATLRAMPDRVALYDGGGQLMFANHAGRPGPLDDLLAGTRIGDLPAGVREIVTPAFERARTGHLDLVDIEKHGLHSRVRLIPFGSGPRRGVALVASDITRQRRMEEELRASVVKADALLDALPDMMFRVRSDGVVVDFQPAWAEKLAAPAERVVGRSLADVLPSPLAEQTVEALALVLENGQSQRFEFPLSTPAGEHEYEARLSSAGPDGVVAIVRDITEAKRLQAQLALADRLAALGTLAAGLAHEINNPLTYVLIGIEAVFKELRRKSDDEPIGPRLPLMLERLQGAIEGARRVRRIVSELRSLARVDEQDQRPVDVCAVLDSAAAMVESQLRHRARLVREYRHGLPPILGRPERLGQVFLNLLLNAAQAVQEGGAPDSAIYLRADLDAAGRVVVEIEDSGPGIPSQELSKIFDPLFTSKPVVFGTGFGLWVSHTIVSSLGGELTARSRVGEGSVFRVALPAAPLRIESGEPIEPRRQERVDDELMALELGRVLIIDDDRQVTASMAILFEGNEVQVVHSGREGLSRLLAGEEYDWIFCDLMMRDVSGMDLYEEVRRARPGLEQRFIFMTGGAFTARAREFVAEVKCPCLAKPFHPHQVVAALRRRPASAPPV
ncbi:MAG TPA: ATP-binding protein [Kofleriaceae bacterium]|nr:ATP-binding protein [Kofleriaceae bacterium]